MKLYAELAQWWPLLSSPEDYANEAATFAELMSAGRRDPSGRALLELGSGGGNNALHLKSGYETVDLVDIAPDMLAVSRELNPDCEHFAGDMRTVRLDRTYDAVFVHDAVEYMTTESDLRAAIVTAFVHCKPGGVALFVPDYVRETFKPHTDHGGHDAPDGRGARYLEWVFDPDPADDTYSVEFAVLTRDIDGAIGSYHDHHEFGLFARVTWLRLLAEAGFTVTTSSDRWGRELFVAARPAGDMAAAAPK